jgi:hypothetical protein
MCGDMKNSRKNPNLSVLDRLNEMLPPMRMTCWPWRITCWPSLIEYEVSG